MTIKNVNKGLFAMFAILLLGTASVLPAASAQTEAQQIAQANEQARAELESKTAKFNQLYNEDSEFKYNIDLYRKTLFSDDGIDDAKWEILKRTLNVVLLKTTGKTMPAEVESEVRAYIENDAVQVKATKQLIRTDGDINASINFLSTCPTSSNYLPALYQPTSDILNGNGLYRTYQKMTDGSIYSFSLPGECVIEVTYAYYDEDHPTIDWLYDQVRNADWGRYDDIETFFVVVTKSSHALDRLSFQKLTLTEGGTVRTVGAIYSGGNTWNNEAHNTAKITSFNYYSGNHPKVYVNTWNHALSESDNNSGMSDSIHSTWVSTTNGNRLTAENAISSHTYTQEDLVAAP